MSEDYTVRDVPLGFAPIPPELVMWTDKGGKPLTGTEIRVWSMLSMHRDLMTQKTTAGVVRMSKMLNVDRTTIQRAVNRLVEAGFLLHRKRRRDPESGTFTPAEFTLAIGGKPMRLGLVTTDEIADEEPDNHHDASAHSHDAHHDAHHDASAHTKRELKESGKESSPEGTDKPVTADEFVSYLAEELDTADVPYAAGWRGRHGKQFKECIGKDVPTETLYKACDRIAERWNDERHHKLTVEHALGDVLNGGSPKHTEKLSQGAGRSGTSTPQEIIEYVFANTRNPVIKSGEERIRSAMAAFDFTFQFPI